MRMSQYFLPTLKEDPSEAQIVSHRLMLRAGMIRQSSAGIYSWLPLGLKVLRKVEQIVREEQDAAGCQELLMPTIQPAELWQESGRYDDYGAEMLRIRDRHDRDMLYGPTNEELITEIVRAHIRSYKDLPKLLYHIQWKFRDEVRPRFGVMRGREFLMKDSYSFDLTYEGARAAYNRMFVAYLRTFARMGLKAIPMAADTGPIGGDLSHEFIILAETGESEVFCHRDLLEFDVLGEDVDYAADLQPVVDRWTSLYAATDEKHDEAEAAKLGDALVNARGIEIGHIFYFGTKYSKAMNAAVTGPDGEQVFPEMGSYGIGVSRLVGGLIEAFHDENGIIWPEVRRAVRRCRDQPQGWRCGLRCGLRGSLAKLRAAGVDPLYEDRDERAGAKFADMDLIGVPWQIVVGPRGIKNGVVEFKNRASGEREEISVESALARLTG